MPPKSKKKKEELTEQELYDVMEFAKQAYSLYPNVFSPDLVNARLKDLNMNPLSGTETDINKALANPKDSEEQLIGFSQFFELTDMLYKRQLLYLGNLPSFDLTYTCINADYKDYTTSKFKKDEQEVIDFLDKFDYVKEFKTILRQLLRQESYFGILREDGEKYIIQELPRQNCRLTGRWDYGFLYDFNMHWFLQPGVDLDFYPKIFKKLFKDVFGKNQTSNYNPSLLIDKRNSSYVHWHQVSPKDGFCAWKLTPEIITQVPFFSPLFPDLVLKPFVRNLQKNKYVIEAYKIMIGIIPMLKDNKSGNIRDALALDPATAGKFANLISQGLPSAIKFGVAPFEDVKQFDFKGDGVNILDQFNKVSVGQGGTNTRLLYATDKMNMEETKSSLAIDEQVVTYLYPFFEEFLNYHINKRLKKFKFSFRLEGTNMPSNRKGRLEDAIGLLDKGIVLPQKISAAMGMKPQEFERQMDMARANKWTDKLTPIVTAYTNSGKSDGKAEKPKKPDDELTESGMVGRDYD